MRRYLIVSLVLVLLAAVLAGCAVKSLAATNAFSHACEAGGECAVYMTLTNPTRDADALVGARTSVAPRTELHKLRIDAQGGMVMEPVQNVPLPASGTVDLKPGSRHLMLVGLTRELRAGDVFDLTLLYESGREEIVQVAVMPEN